MRSILSLFNIRIIMLLCFLVFLTGCAPTEEEIINAYKAVYAAAGMQLFRSKFVKELSHFLFNRIRWLLEQNNDWNDSPNYSKLITRLTSEINAVDAYINLKIGTRDAPGPLGSQADPGPVPHIDLKDVAQISASEDASTVNNRMEEYIRSRRQHVRQIVWRAAAIHPELWSGNASDLNTSLKTSPLDEILDRRLRMVERMTYIDDAQPGPFNWTVTAANSGWKDGKRTVLFEYPFLSAELKAKLVAAGFLPTLLAGEFYEDDKEQVRFRKSGRVRQAAQDHWELSGYKWTMKLNGKTPSEIFDLLMPSVSPVTGFEDYWDRNWVFCDHMAAALHVDCLRFALHRRTGSETDFNNAAAAGVTLHVPVPSIGSADPKDMMAKGDDYFEGVEVVTPNLQVGDHIIIWNNYFLRAILRTDFGLENSIVSDIWGENPRNSFLVGHGAANTDYTSFVEDLLSNVKKLVEGFQKRVTLQIKADITNGNEDPNDPLFLTNGRTIKRKFGPIDVEVVFWAPFGERFFPKDASQNLAVQGAWWIRIRLADTAGARPALTIAQALNLFPHSVSVDTSYHKPPINVVDATADFKESIYIPLSLPYGVRGEWKTYFKDGREGNVPVNPVNLVDAKVDQSWAPGFHFAYQGSKIPVLRPKIRI